MNNKAIYAELHSPFFIPNVDQKGTSLNIKKHLPPTTSLLPGLVMEYQPNGSLLLSWISGAVTKRFIVCASNVSTVMLEPETPVAKVAKGA